MIINSNAQLVIIMRWVLIAVLVLYFVDIYAEVDMPAWLRHILLAARMALPSGVILADRLEKIGSYLPRVIIRRGVPRGRSAVQYLAPEPRE